MEQLSTNARLARFIINILPSVLTLKSKLEMRKNLLLVCRFFSYKWIILPFHSSAVMTVRGLVTLIILPLLVFLPLF